MKEDKIRVMALHALAYCERLFYLEEVEEIKLADASVFAGRTLHEDLKKVEELHGSEWCCYELSSNNIGLVGKVDCLKTFEGSLIPYEHKRGRARKSNGKAGVWDADELQVWAYCMLLEEHVNCTVEEGRVRYHKDNVTVRIPFDNQARDAVKVAVERAKNLRRSTERPPVCKNERLCVECSLAPVCLPEESRFSENPSRKTIRLFPAHQERVTVYINEQGARVGRSGEILSIKSRDRDEKRIPMNKIGCLVLQGFVQVSAQAIHTCVQKGIHIQWMSHGGRHVASVFANNGAVQRKMRQYNAMADGALCLGLARRLVRAKMEMALRYFLRSTRGKSSRTESILGTIKDMRKQIESLDKADSTVSLLGHEGYFGKAYFKAIPGLLGNQVDTALSPTGRSRRPPKDRFNAILSFGYALLYQAVLRCIYTVGLEPALGFFHTARSSAYPLVMDLMEMFRVPIWDIVVIGSINRLQWHQDEDFDIAGERIWLSKNGRIKAIKLFEQRLDEKWKHPAIGYSLSYARLIELEVRLLEKEWTENTKLFATMRLR